MAARLPTFKPPRLTVPPRCRPSASARGYGGNWPKLRAYVLAGEPLCRECKGWGRLVPATDVDHIISRSRGGTDDLANLQPLCHACHASKTAREDGGFGHAK